MSFGGRRGPILFGLALSAGLVIWLLGRLDLSEVGRALASAAPGPLVFATLSYAALFPLRGLRWAVLLGPLAERAGTPPVPVGLATRAFLVGFMANNVLPARLGDVIRALVLAREARVPRTGSLATVLLEKVFDGLTVVAILGFALATLPLSAEAQAPYRAVGAVMAAGFGGALLACVLLTWAEEPTLRLAARLLGPLPAGLRDRILGRCRRVAGGLAALRTPGLGLRVGLLSVAIWLLEVVVYVGVAASLGLDLSFTSLALVMAVLTLGLTAPSAPGFVGVFEALVIPSLGLVGVPPAPAAAFALILHAIHFAPGTLLGAIAAYRSGLKAAELRTLSSS